MSDVSTSGNPDPKGSDVEALERERYEALQRLEDWLEIPMLVLAFVWLALLIVELIWGESLWFEIIGTAIWVIFLLNFAVELALARESTPNRGGRSRGTPNQSLQQTAGARLILGSL